MRAERSVLVHSFELVCATKSRALREVRSRRAHCEVSIGASAIQRSDPLPRCKARDEDRRAIIKRRHRPMSTVG
jgi:hypothetical protein